MFYLKQAEKNIFHLFFYYLLGNKNSAFFFSMHYTTYKDRIPKLHFPVKKQQIINKILLLIIIVETQRFSFNK